MNWFQKAQGKINDSWYWKVRQEIAPSYGLNSTVNNINKWMGHLYGNDASFYVASTPSSGIVSKFYTLLKSGNYIASGE
ncbi:MAG: hypothetical protein WC119_01240 [Synergistaceae bacterium]